MNPCRSVGPGWSLPDPHLILDDQRQVDVFNISHRLGLLLPEGTLRHPAGPKVPLAPRWPQIAPPAIGAAR
jgi:hypothetical protein